MLNFLFKSCLLLLNMLCIYLNGWVLYWVAGFIGYTVKFKGCFDLSGTMFYLCNNSDKIAWLKFFITTIPLSLLLLFNICFALYKIKQGKFGTALYGGLSLLVILGVYMLYISLKS